MRGKREGKKRKPVLPSASLRSTFNDELLIPVRISRRREEKEHEELLSRSVAKHREAQASAVVPPPTASAASATPAAPPSVLSSTASHVPLVSKEKIAARARNGKGGRKRSRSSAAVAARKRIVEERKAASVVRRSPVPDKGKSGVENAKESKEEIIDQKMQVGEKRDNVGEDGNCEGEEKKDEAEDLDFLQRLQLVNSISDGRAKVEAEQDVKRQQIARRCQYILCDPPSIVEKMGLPKDLLYIEQTVPSSNELPCIAFRPAPPELVHKYQRIREGKKASSSPPETKVLSRGGEKIDPAKEAATAAAQRIADVASDIQGNAEDDQFAESRQERQGQKKQGRRRKAKGGYQQSTSSGSGSEGRQSSGASKATRAHVATCTCAACRKRRRSAAKRPTKLKYQMVGPMIAVVRATFAEHGFVMTNRDDWNVLWSSRHMRTHVYQGLNRYQMVSQYPRSAEITTKDNLCRNFVRMQAAHGKRHFDFCPETFVLPAENELFFDTWKQSQGTPWIVKPAKSAQGRGIFVTNDFYDIPSSTDYIDSISGSAGAGSSKINGGCNTMTVSRYIDNPLLLDGKKFDLRLYVIVTSFNPLRLYLYEEGLCRIATVDYQGGSDQYSQRMMHLTNYSINKHSKTFAQNDNIDAQEGHKWGLRAFRRRLASMGIDDEKLWQQIEDIIIKTIICMESQVNVVAGMHKFKHSNCFQLFGFDVLIDENLRPWLLEVNFSPSLATDSKLDMKIKSALIADILTLVGIRPYDAEKTALQKKAKALSGVKGGIGSKQKQQKKKGSKEKRASVAPRRLSSAWPEGHISERKENLEMKLTPEDRRAIRTANDELVRSRCGTFAWSRLFPSPTSFTYNQFFEEERPLNLLLAHGIVREKFEKDLEPGKERYPGRPPSASTYMRGDGNSPSPSASGKGGGGSPGRGDLLREASRMKSILQGRRSKREKESAFTYVY